MSPTTHQLFLSSLFGTALGDAWGYPHEFVHASGIPTPVQFSGDGGTLKISDDTQMTLALLTATGRINFQQRIGFEDPSAMPEMASLIAEEFLAYNIDDDNDRAPGVAVTGALDALDMLGDPSRWPETTSGSGGCGAVMRLTPAALLMPRDQRVAWSVLQAQVTHDSAVARASSAVLAVALNAGPRDSLFDLVLTMAGQPLLTDDDILRHQDGASPLSVPGVLRDLDAREYELTRGGHRQLLSVTELLHRTGDIYGDVAGTPAATDLAALRALGDRVSAEIGDAWDAASCTAGAVLLAQLHRDHAAETGAGPLTALDMLGVGVNWIGDRDSRGAVLGGLLGALAQPDWEAQFVAQEGRRPEFEPRYDAAVRAGQWKGFARQ